MGKQTRKNGEEERERRTDEGGYSGSIYPLEKQLASQPPKQLLMNLVSSTWKAAEQVPESSSNVDS